MPSVFEWVFFDNIPDTPTSTIQLSDRQRTLITSALSFLEDSNGWSADTDFEGDVFPAISDIYDIVGGLDG